MAAKHYRNNKQKYISRAIKQRKNNRDWFLEYKSTLSCERCGENSVACLDFHHPSDNKENDVGAWCATVVQIKLKKRQRSVQSYVLTATGNYISQRRIRRIIRFILAGQSPTPLTINTICKQLKSPQNSPPKRQMTVWNPSLHANYNFMSGSVVNTHGIYAVLQLLMERYQKLVSRSLRIADPQLLETPPLKQGQSDLFWPAQCIQTS